MPLWLELFLSFFKVGAVSFGGGYGMISLLCEEVARFGISEAEFLNFVAVAESTPGPIAVNMATFVGAAKNGFLGAVCATAGVVLPAFIIILLLCTLVKGLFNLKGVQAFLKGVRPVVIGLIVATGLCIAIEVILGLEAIGSSIEFDYKALIIFTIVAITHVIYKRIKKKSISPILLIILSAILGMVLYGMI